MEPDQTSALLLSVANHDAGYLEKKWFEECQQLYFEIALKLEQGSVKPVKNPAGTDDRSLFANLFQNLLLKGINLSVFSGLYNLLKLWIMDRKACEVTITYPDGFTLKVSTISLDTALELHRKHGSEISQNTFFSKEITRKSKK